jgi:hypothetical protein
MTEKELFFKLVELAAGVSRKSGFQSFEEIAEETLWAIQEGIKLSKEVEKCGESHSTK